LFKIGEIRELIRLVDETSVTELKVENGETKLVIRKASEVVTTVQTAPVSTTPQVSAPVAAPATLPTSMAEPAASHANASEPEQGVHFITSPMVGTFYRSPSPDAPSYADNGTSVTEKTVVCIVEAMKLMNEIEAEVRGEVLEVLAENGQLVEYGQPLFKIKLS
jgi:acetyl-CoA carboxylase biotin carboxyl carrier protein